MNKCLFCSLIFLQLVLNISCERKKPPEDLENFKSRYLSHTFLDGDSSIVVATLVTDSLQVPWEITMGPDGWIWFTEQRGLVKKVNPETGEQKTLLRLDDLVFQRSRGLYSMVLHPDFETEPYVYLNYTYYLPDTATSLKVVRYTYKDERLINPFIVIDNIPGETYHNGSRLIITKDKKIMVTTGDAGKMDNSQNINILSGKILRINLNGTIPHDNPIAGSPVWAWGLRNSQGLVQASNERIYISEHGPDNDDEINLIQKAGNYGWPDVMGFCDLPSEKQRCIDIHIIEPLIAWSPVIAPSGLDYYNHKEIAGWNNALILGSLKNQTLRVLHLNTTGEKIVKEEEYFSEEFGRIRDICISPDGEIFISTSNEDWHPKHFPMIYSSNIKKEDDRIISIRKATKEEEYWLKTLPEYKPHQKKKVKKEFVSEDNLLPGAKLYNQYCSGCHQLDGEGIKGLFPPLAQSEWVLEDEKRLIKVMLQGLTGPVEVRGEMYNQQMPPFRYLSNEQLAEVLTYIRQNFGNNAEPISQKHIEEVRAQQ